MDAIQIRPNNMYEYVPETITGLDDDVIAYLCGMKHKNLFLLSIEDVIDEKAEESKDKIIFETLDLNAFGLGGLQGANILAESMIIAKKGEVKSKCLAYMSQSSKIIKLYMNFDTAFYNMINPTINGARHSSISELYANCVTNALSEYSKQGYTTNEFRNVLRQQSAKLHEILNKAYTSLTNPIPLIILSDSHLNLSNRIRTRQMVREKFLDHLNEIRVDNGAIKQIQERINEHRNQQQDNVHMLMYPC